MISTGLDFRIDQMKVKLSELSSLFGTIYGRVHRINEKNGRTVPAILESTRGDYKILTPDENPESFTLLYPTGSQVIDGEPNFHGHNIMRTKMDIIYFGDQRKIFPEDQQSHINTNIISTLMLNKLKEFEYFLPESVEEQSPQVYSMFTFDFGDKYYFYPFMCFRIRGDLFFNDMGNSDKSLQALGINSGIGDNSVLVYDHCAKKDLGEEFNYPFNFELQ